MNYYNPYFYSFPYTNVAPKVGLFSRLLGGKGLTLGGIVNGTQKTLGFINQAIPVVKQASPIVKNAKTMFKVMNEFKKKDTPNKENNSIRTKVVNNNTIKKNNQEKTSIKEIETNNGPTFFV